MKSLNSYGRLQVGLLALLVSGLVVGFLGSAVAQQQTSTGVYSPHGASGTLTPVYVTSYPNVPLTSTPSFSPTPTISGGNTATPSSHTPTYTPTRTYTPDPSLLATSANQQLQMTPAVALATQMAGPFLPSPTPMAAGLFQYATTVVGASAVTVTPPLGSYNVLTVHSKGSNTSLVQLYNQSTLGVTLLFSDLASPGVVASTIGGTGNTYRAPWPSGDAAIFTPSGAVTLEAIWSYNPSNTGQLTSGWLSTAVTVAMTPGTYTYRANLPIVSNEIGIFANSVVIESQPVTFGMLPVGNTTGGIGGAYASFTTTNGTARSFSPYLNTGSFVGSGPSSIIAIAVLATLTITPGTTINFIVTQKIMRGAYYRGGKQDRYCWADYELDHNGAWKPTKFYIRYTWIDAFDWFKYGNMARAGKSNRLG